jgi:hypothetical protein
MAGAPIADRAILRQGHGLQRAPRRPVRPLRAHSCGATSGHSLLHRAPPGPSCSTDAHKHALPCSPGCSSLSGCGARGHSEARSAGIRVRHGRDFVRSSWGILMLRSDGVHAQCSSSRDSSVLPRLGWGEMGRPCPTHPYARLRLDAPCTASSARACSRSQPDYVAPRGQGVSEWLVVCHQALVKMRLALVTVGGASVRPALGGANHHGDVLAGAGGGTAHRRRHRAARLPHRAGRRFRLLALMSSW